MENRTTFGLDSVLAALGRDLEAAQKGAAAHAFGLYVDTAEVELAFTVEGSDEGGGDLNLKVFGVGFGGDVKHQSSQETVHRITLTLSPKKSGSRSTRRPVAARR